MGARLRCSHTDAALQFNRVERTYDRTVGKDCKTQNQGKKTITGVRRLRGTESVGAKLALQQENSLMMQRVETIPKRRLVITRGKVHFLRKDVQGQLSAGRRAEGKKKKFPRPPQVPTENWSQKRLSVHSCSALPPTGGVDSRDRGVGGRGVCVWGGGSLGAFPRGDGWFWS